MIFYLLLLKTCLHATRVYDYSSATNIGDSLKLLCGA